MKKNPDELQARIDNLFEQMIFLCEIRGQLDCEANQKTESQIAAFKDEIQNLQALNNALR